MRRHTTTLPAMTLATMTRCNLVFVARYPQSNAERAHEHSRRIRRLGYGTCTFAVDHAYGQFEVWRTAINEETRIHALLANKEA